MGGVLIKGVFGLVTEQDLKTLQDTFNNSTSQLIHAQEAILVETDLLKAAIVQLNHLLERQINETTLLFEGVFARLDISDHLSLAAETLQNIQAIFTRYQQILDHLRDGRSEDIITPQLLDLLISKNRKKLDPSLRLPCEPRACRINALIKIQKTKNSLTFLAIIPLCTTTSFQISELTPIPTADGEGQFFLADKLPRYIGWNSRTYFETNHLDCSDLFCSQLEELVNMNVTSCASELVRNPRDTPSCHFRPLNPRAYYSRSSTLSWVVYFFVPTDVSISCSISEEVRHIQVKGLFTIQKRCQVSSKWVQLHAPTDIYSDQQLPFRRESTSHTFHLPFNSSDTLSNQTEGFQMFRRIREEIQNLQEGLTKNSSKPSISRRFKFTTDLHLGMSTGAACLGGLALFSVSFLCWRSRRDSVRTRPSRRVNLRMDALPGGTL